MSTAKKVTAKKPDEKKVVSGVFLQNKEGRVFVGTPPLIKQMSKGKFGLVRITKAVYDEAVKNGGMTEALPDTDDDGEGEE